MRSLQRNPRLLWAEGRLSEKVGGSRGESAEKFFGFFGAIDHDEARRTAFGEALNRGLPQRAEGGFRC
jgi:hypothetical protein